MSEENLDYLVDEINRLIDRRNALVREYNDLAEDLAGCIDDAIVVTNNVVYMHNALKPNLEGVSAQVHDAAIDVEAVGIAIKKLSSGYFTIKEISTASKKLTQLREEYEKKFGLYNILRRVALGYVVGVDKHIISNEKLRKTAEENYLQNAEYWISHCLMATMLWVSDEQEAAYRALNKAMSIDPHKSSLYFLLVNLHFGRTEAAASWFEYYIKDVDVSNVGDEIRILLQAYLYNICGKDEEFKAKIGKEFTRLFSEIKKKTRDYDSKVNAKVLEFIDSYVHKSFDEFSELHFYVEDYDKMMLALNSAEKNTKFAKYFDDLYNKDSEAPMDLIDRIQNILYDLISTYDEAEEHIIREMDRNEMILSAKGDIGAAQKMYSAKYGKTNTQTLGDVMIKLAFPSAVDEVDIRVKKFSVKFLSDSILSSFEKFRERYLKTASETHKVTVDSVTVTVDEKKPEKAIADMREHYKKNRKRIVKKDSGVKTLTVFTWLFWISWLCCTGVAAYFFVNEKPWHPILIGGFALTFVAAVAFTVWRYFKMKKVGAHLIARMNAAIEKLETLISSIKEWRKKFEEADEKNSLLKETLNKFTNDEERV